MKNLIDNPILLEDLKSENYNYDQHLIEGFQSATMPLEKKSFKNIMNKTKNLEFDFSNKEISKESDLEKLEEEYRHAVPEVRKEVSRQIERGKIAKEFKKITKYKCQICDALG